MIAHSMHSCAKTKNVCPLKAFKKPTNSDFSISMSETSWNFDIPTHIEEKDFMLLNK